MKTSKTTITLGIASACVIAAALIVKWQFFPAVKDSYFVPDQNNLSQAPGGVVVVRPTHFAQSTNNGTCDVEDHGALIRMVGRDVPLQSVIAEAYDKNPERVVLPPDAPKICFDYLVTVPTQPRERMQSAIRHKLSYRVHEENRDVEVLSLKVINSNLPGFKASTASEKPDINYQDGRLYFTHEPLRVILKGLEEGLVVPVMDETGLTDCYDFSVVWNQDIQQQMHAGGFGLDGVNKVLAGWGLQLVPDRRTMNMLIVDKAP